MLTPGSKDGYYDFEISNNEEKNCWHMYCLLKRLVAELVELVVWLSETI